MLEEAKLTVLNNGMRIVTKQINNFDSVVLGYWIEAGGACEKESECGISHFLEHMAFKGTTSRSAKQIAEEIESVGGFTNAYTSKEVTAYHAKVLKEDTDLAIDIMSDILQNPAFLQDELERERGVILQEISQSFDTPDDIIFDHFQNTAFQNQAMGRPILGPADIVSKINANDLRQYRNTFYNSDNIVFAAVGNLCHDQLIEKASKYFYNFSSQKTPKQNTTFKYIGGHYSDQRNLEQTHLIVGFNGMPISDPDYYTLAIFSSILGGGMSSRLFQEIREKRGLVYSVYSFSSSYKYNGTFGVYAATSSEKLKELSDVIACELMKMSDKITEKEFNRTKAQFRSGLLMSRESSSATCEQIVNQVMIFNKIITRDEILKKLDSVTIDDVKNLTKRILASKASVVTVGNTNCDKVLPELISNGIIAD